MSLYDIPESWAYRFDHHMLPRLTPREEVILRAYCRVAGYCDKNPDGKVYPMRQSVAAIARCSPCTVARATTRLVQMKAMKPELESRHPGQGKPNCYLLTFPYYIPSKKKNAHTSAPAPASLNGHAPEPPRPRHIHEQELPPLYYPPVEPRPGKTESALVTQQRKVAKYQQRVTDAEARGGSMLGDLRQKLDLEKRLLAKLETAKESSHAN